MTTQAKTEPRKSGARDAESKTRVAIIGGSGYGAAELLRNLVQRTDVEVTRVSSKDHVGQKLGEVHRALGYSAARSAAASEMQTSVLDLVLEDIPPAECAENADVVFLAMPHVTTAKVAMELFDLDVKIIDLSGDFRLENLVDYVADYAPEHPCPERLGTFVYGMPELNAKEISEARYVASPGCFATAIALALLPLADAGKLTRTTIRTVAMTGSSGSGVRPQAGTHHAVRVNNLKAYRPLHHQHRAEILQTLTAAGAADVALDFVPVSAPLARGILAVSQLDLPDELTDESVRVLYEEYFEQNQLVNVMRQGQSAEVVAVAGTARVEIGLDTRFDPATGQRTLAVTAAIDNLIKGGAGQAIQSFNLMTGHDSNFGLDAPGLWP